MSLMNFLQAASNTAADTVAGPVDLFSFLLNKAGVPIQEPVGGSEWMKKRGLKKDVPQNVSSLAGETVGLLSPVAAAAKAPQIARGLLTLGDAGAPAGTLTRGMASGQRGAFVFPQEEALKTAQRNAAKPVSEGGLGLRPDNTAAERAKAMGFVEEAFHGTKADIFQIKPSSKSARFGPGVYTTNDPARASSYAITASGDSAPNVVPLLTQKPDFVYGAGAINIIDKPHNVRSRFAAFDPAKRDSINILATLAALGVGVPLFAPTEDGK